MKTTLLTVAATIFLIISGISPATAQATPPATATASSPASNLEYRMISGYKQPFNDELQEKVSRGWTPIGGVSVTTWNNDLFFAQLLSRPAGSGQ